jgi:hypothetical protein
MRIGEVCACAAMATSLAALAPAARADTPPAPPAPDAERAPRPALPPLPEAKPLPWEQHAEIGAGIAFVENISSTTAGDGSVTPVRLRPGVGFHVRLGWELFRYLTFTGYMVEVDQTLVMPAGSLGFTGAVVGPAAHTYFFGGRVSPTLPIGDRARLWATVGGGWGVVAYPDLTVVQLGGAPSAARAPFTIRGRTADVVEIPLGLGASFDIIPRWLRVHTELTYSFYPSQLGDALQTGQAVDGTGMLRSVGAMPHLDGAFIQTLGLSLIL